ncbi:MAG: family 78 glycoside hydrolase catalytic domain, partial [Sphingobacterium siyangense]
MKTMLQKLGILGFLIVLNFSTFAQKLAVIDLKVEHLSNPLAIETEIPRLSWKITSTEKNTQQAEYEIRVGTDKVFLNKDKDLVWKHRSSTDQSVLIDYAGSPLQSKKKYFWQVRVKDNHGNTSAWSTIGFFQMGISTSDWSAQWITVSGKDTSSRSPLFRKEFSLKKKIKSAMAYITAKGLYEAKLNGARISDTYFAPGWTSYKNQLQYQVYDVTALLRVGSNVLGASLGNGWYKGRIGFGNQHNFYGDTRGLLLQLEVEYTDGTKETINTDENWKYTYGPIMASDIYDGEIYDARMEITGWDNIDFKEDSNWKNVNVMNKGTEKLIAMSGPHVRKHEQFKALSIFKTPKGETVVDFGQNLVGWVILKAQGPTGTKITLSHAEVLTKEGNFYTTNLRSAKAQDSYILKGGAEQVFEPHFTFQGFRYVKVEGYPGE